MKPPAFVGGLQRLADEGSDALKRKDFETASLKFHEILEADPSQSGARVGYALSEIALGRDPMALSVILDGLARDGGDPDLHELLGDLRNREERVEDALEAWREAFRLSPNDRLREKILKGEREQHAGRDYSFSAAPHFNVRFDGNLDPALAEAVGDFLETKYRDLSDTFRHAPPQPITVLLYPDREFRDVTQAPEWVGGLYDGKIRVPLGGIRRLDPRACAVLTHELAHAVIYSKTRGNCPRWIHEGLAQRAEGREISRADRVRIERLFEASDPAAWDGRGFSYPAALSLTRYLEGLRDFQSIVQLLDRMGDGKDLDAALQDVYGVTYGELCRRWARDLTSANPR